MRGDWVPHEKYENFKHFIWSLKMRFFPSMTDSPYWTGKSWFLLWSYGYDDDDYFTRNTWSSKGKRGETSIWDVLEDTAFEIKQEKKMAKNIKFLEQSDTKESEIVRSPKLGLRGICWTGGLMLKNCKGEIYKNTLGLFSWEKYWANYSWSENVDSKERYMIYHLLNQIDSILILIGYRDRGQRSFK